MSFVSALQRLFTPDRDRKVDYIAPVQITSEGTYLSHDTIAEPRTEEEKKAVRSFNRLLDETQKESARGLCFTTPARFAAVRVECGPPPLPGGACMRSTYIGRKRIVITAYLEDILRGITSTGVPAHELGHAFYKHAKSDMALRSLIDVTLALRRIRPNARNARMLVETFGSVENVNQLLIQAESIHTALHAHLLPYAGEMESLDATGLARKLLDSHSERARLDRMLPRGKERTFLYRLGISLRELNPTSSRGDLFTLHTTAEHAGESVSALQNHQNLTNRIRWDIIHRLGSADIGPLISFHETLLQGQEHMADHFSVTYVRKRNHLADTLQQVNETDRASLPALSSDEQTLQSLTKDYRKIVTHPAISSRLRFIGRH